MNAWCMMISDFIIGISHRTATMYWSHDIADSIEELNYSTPAHRTFYHCLSCVCVWFDTRLLWSILRVCIQLYRKPMIYFTSQTNDESNVKRRHCACAACISIVITHTHSMQCFGPKQQIWILWLWRNNITHIWIYNWQRFVKIPSIRSS